MSFINKKSIHSNSSSNPSSGDSFSSKFTSISSSTDKIVLDLRALHLRITHGSCHRDEQLVEALRDHYDEQVARRHKLERELAQLEEEIETQEHLVDLESNDDERQLKRLYAEYPNTMERFQTRVHQNTVSKCRDIFELKKQQMIIENNQKMDEMTTRYQREFKKMIQRLEVDSTRIARMRSDYAKT